MTSKFITIDPDKSPLKTNHHLLLGGVAPRPIALVSTVSADGRHNLAPFSFFNAFGANPPYVAFSPSYSGIDGSPKDTLQNVKEVAECVIHAVPNVLVEQVNLASTAFARGVDEFVKAGLTPIDSDLVIPKRVKESPFHMECVVEQIIPLGNKNGSGNLVLCKVVRFHLQEHIYFDGQIDPQVIDLVGRNSGNFYTRASGEAIFEVKKPSGIGIGIDQLPDHIKHSKILSANNLAQLGGLTQLPEQDAIEDFIKHYLNAPIGSTRYITYSKDYMRVFASACSQMTSNPDQSSLLMEQAAKEALDHNDVEFAIHALQSVEALV